MNTILTLIALIAQLSSGTGVEAEWSFESDGSARTEKPHIR